ncbi:hypothetical protein RND71_012736 [Anisodus tanguticus]|uniref:Pyrroline-5-carboxylate reductase n=1 Tax=Anisodus tanguticus TaxID=243964 RepID=A0AAE1SG75_9SOLA|nr:hypothetical protein RND71_012736 [Anisodus tanguticus]
MSLTKQNQENQEKSIISSMFLIKIMSKRRTWVFVFVSVYTILLSISWNFLKAVLSWYESTMSANSSNPTNSIFSGWPALYASVLLGLAFGILSMVAALAVAFPATLVTWITILVLLTFAGKNRRDLVLEGKKLTGDIIGFVVKVLIKEGNVVAALCAVLGYFALVITRNKQDEHVDY